MNQQTPCRHFGNDIDDIREVLTSTGASSPIAELKEDMMVVPFPFTCAFYGGAQNTTEDKDVTCMCVMDCLVLTIGVRTPFQSSLSFKQVGQAYWPYSHKIL